MISGHDSLFVTAGDVSRALLEFLTEWSKRWPQMRVSLNSGDFVDWPTTVAAPSGRAEVLVAKDHRMESRWGEEGYFAANNEGPFAILFEPVGPSRLKALVLEDPYERDPAFGFTPYEVTMLCGGLAIVTLVSPDSDEGFGAEVADLLERCLDRVRQ